MRRSTAGARGSPKGVPINVPVPAGVDEALQNAVLDSADVGDFLSSLADLAARELSTPEHVVLCGVTLLRPRTAGTVASSEPDAEKMDELQYKYDDGPCLRAAREGTLYSVPDFARESRFPDYTAAVRNHGVRSALGVPIILDAPAYAGLNLYSRTAGAFDDDAIAQARQLARDASMALRLAVRIANLTDTGTHLTAAMESRTTIDLAAGIIMGQNRCSQEQAMRILQMASSSRNQKLRAVAAGVVESIGHGPPRTHFEPLTTPSTSA